MHRIGDHSFQPQNEQGWDVQRGWPWDTQLGNPEPIKGEAAKGAYLAVHAELKLWNAACSRNPSFPRTFRDGQSVPRPSMPMCMSECVSYQTRCVSPLYFH